MTAGRPTKYTDEMPQKVDEYIESCGDFESEFHKTRGQSSDTYERTIDVKLPKVEGFAIHIGVHTDTLYEWAKVHPKFSVALESIKLVQKNMLQDGGISGKYNSTIAKLILSSNHGMNEKTETKIDGTLNISTEKKQAIDDALEEVIE